MKIMYSSVETATLHNNVLVYKEVSSGENKARIQ
jgi:hypothetical protein